MKLRAAVAGFRGQPWYAHLLAVVVGLGLYAVVYTGFVAVQGGLPLLWVTGATPFRWRAALVAGLLTGGYYGWLVTRARGGPATNLFAVLAGPLVVPQLVAWVLGDRVPGTVLAPNRYGMLALVFLSVGAGIAVVWAWGWRAFDTGAERRDWLAEHLPPSVAETMEAAAPDGGGDRPEE